MISTLETYARDGWDRIGLEFDRLRLRTGRLHDPLDVDRVVDSLSDGGHVLMLCAGNICRSPLAHRYLQARLDARGIDDVTVESAGYLGPEGRPSPDTAHVVADELDVDLSAHRSRLLTRELLERADVAFVMDVRNYRHYTRAFPEHADDFYLLGAMSTRYAGRGGDDEIIDPDGESAETFRTVYGEVTTAVDDLVRALDGER